MPEDSAREPPPLHAGFWRRLAAASIDGLVLGVLSIPLLIASVAIDVAVLPIVLLVALLIYSWRGHRPPARGTPGQRGVGIAVTRRDGDPVTGSTAALRTVVLVATLGLGLILAAFTPRKQALHDLLAGTFVVRSGATPEEIRRGSGTMPVDVSVVVLIVAALVLPLALVAFSVSAYLDMRHRSEVVGILVAVKPLQREVESARASGGALPVGPAALQSAHAKAARVVPSGAIVVDVADTLAPGGRLTYTPETSAAGTRWKCRAEGIHRSYLPGDCRD